MEVYIVIAEADTLSKSPNFQLFQFTNLSQIYLFIYFRDKIV